MKLHPMLDDPQTVLIVRTPVPEKVAWDDFRRAAAQVMAAMALEIEDEAVVLKPNVTAGESYDNPDTGIITHAGFVQGLAEYLTAHGARRDGVYVLEDPRNHNDNAPRSWRNTGYPEMAQATGAKLRTPTTHTCVKRPVPNPHCHATMTVSRLAVAPKAVLINVPKMKTHNLGITTLSMKNLMGVVNVFDRHFCQQAWNEIPEAVAAGKRPKKEWMDRRLHEQWQTGLARRLVDLAQVVQPRLNIVEGVIAREGTGFNRGRNRALGLAVAGTNMVAVDAVASTLMGFDPQALIYLRMAAEAGLGTSDVRHLRILTVENDELVPCKDWAAFAAQPPLQVISDILGEQEIGW